MTLYASGDGWELHQAEALDWIRDADADSIDAIITDPPYASGGYTEAERRNTKNTKIKTDGDWFLGDHMGAAAYWATIRRLGFAATRTLKRGGHCLMFCDWRMVAIVSTALESGGLAFRNMLVWDKGYPGLGTGFRPQHEIILHCSRMGGARGLYMRDRRFGNVLSVPRIPGSQKGHPCHKPPTLASLLASAVAPEGGTVVDLFTGSGALGVGALRAGCRFIGIELDPAHLETAAAALRAEESQARIEDLGAREQGALELDS